MATRYYPSVRAARTRYDDTGAQGDWGILGSDAIPANPAQNIWQLQQSKTNAGNQIPLTFYCNQSDYSMYYARWVTPPLEAATLSGNFDMCFGVQALWNTGSGFTADTDASYHIHAYIAQGQTTLVRTTIINDYIDAALFPALGGMVWMQLSTPPSVSGSIVDGDVIIIEVGIKIIDSPVPTPTYPVTQYSQLTFHARGANPAYTDAINGDTSTSKAPWFEFTQTLTEKAASAPPANDACADAIVIGSVPYSSGFIDTTGSTDTDHAVWWEWTAPDDGIVFVTTAGTNYRNEINVYTGPCGSLVFVFGQSDWQLVHAQRGNSGCYFNATSGVTYKIKLTDDVTAIGSQDVGGVARLQVFYQDTNPVGDDIYLPAGIIYAIRGMNRVVNLNPNLSSILTGCAIDYTQTPMDAIGGGVNTSYRLLVGLHDFDIVEILDLPTLSLGDSEVDFILQPITSRHPANLYITAAGELYIGAFGNGYQFVTNPNGPGAAVLNNVSNAFIHSQVLNLGADEGDSQPGAPFTATARTVGIDNYAPWGITIDEANNILYYTDNGYYIPVTGDTVQPIKAWDLTGESQLPDVASITLNSGVCPGIKGLQYVVGVGIFICNSTEVLLIDPSDGSTIQTYIPSIPEYSQCLVDVKVNVAKTKIVVADLFTTQLFEFNIVSGAETATFQPYAHPATFNQIAIFDGITVPTGTIVVVKETTPSGLTEEFEFTAGGGLSPTSFTLADGEQRIFSALAVGSGYSIEEAATPGYSTTYNVSNASPINNISVGDGETVTVTVTNNAVVTGGIYKVVPGKRNDTLWNEDASESVVKIPSPFGTGGYIGD